MNAETAQEEKKQSPEATQEASPAETSTDNVQKNESKAEADPKANVAKQGSAAVNNLRVLENIEVKLTVEVGNTEIKIKDLLRLNEGSVVELERLAGEPLDILANGTRIAKGEVVMVGEKFGIRFTEVADPEELIENL
jgi:flagellar motor switch protein FliN/FliY